MEFALNTIFSIVAEIGTAHDNVQGFETASKRLAMRSELFANYFKAFRDGGSTKHIELLNRCISTLTEVRNFLLELGRANFFRRLWNHRSYASNFTDLQEELTKMSNDCLAIFSFPHPLQGKKKITKPLEWNRLTKCFHSQILEMLY